MILRHKGFRVFYSSALCVAALLFFYGVSSAGAAEGIIAVIGCSYTGEETEGYIRVSSEDSLAGVTREELDGFKLSDWADESPDAWNTVEVHAPDGGYEGAWIQICLDDADINVGITEAHKEMVRSVFERLRADYGLYPAEVYISGEKSYIQGICDERRESVAVSLELADWAVAELGARRGPGVGPISGAMTESDGCHLSSEGENSAGQDIVSYFDGDGPPEFIASTLGVTLYPMLLPGGEPRVVFVALADGTVRGRINYTFYCDSRIPGTSVADGWDAQYLNQAEEASAAICTYSGLGGPFTAKVIVERGTLAAEDRLVFDLR